MPPPPIARHAPVRVPLRTVSDRTEGRADNLTCELNLCLEKDSKRVVPVEFRVDTGASRSFMSKATADFFGLPTPKIEDRRAIKVRLADGQVARLDVFAGRLRVWWNVDRRGDPFDWPVMFVVGAARDAPPLLGLGGVIGDCQWVFDGHPDEDAPFGTATFHDVR